MERYWRKNPIGEAPVPGKKLWENKSKNARLRAKDRYNHSEKGKKKYKEWYEKHREEVLARNRAYKARYRATQKWKEDAARWQERIKRDGRLKKWQKIHLERKKEIRLGNQKWKELLKEEAQWRKKNPRKSRG